MKNFILILVFISSLFSSEFVDIELKDYVSIVAKNNNISIIIDDSIDKKFNIYLSSKINSKDYLLILNTILIQNNLQLKYLKNHFYITTKDKKSSSLNSIYSYNFKYLTEEEINNILSFYKYEFKYIKNIKTAFIDCTNKQFFKLKSIFNKYDKVPFQKKLKITIIDTNLTKLKEYGLENTLNVVSDSQTSLFFNLLAFPFTAENTLNKSNKTSFTSYIKFMNSQNLSNILSSPTVTIFDNKKTTFEVVKNIPYKSGTTTTDGDNTRITESIEYKDIGLKLDVLPIINNNHAFLDLSLTIENILDSSNTPVTSKKFLKQYVSLNKGDIFILNGINQTESYNDDFKTPFLSDIPYIGWLFKSEIEDIKSSNLTILIELI